MNKDGRLRPDYVRKVQDDTRRYIERLLKENETLRSLLARLESEKLNLEERILTVQEQLDAHKKEQLRLHRQLAEIEADNQRFTREYLEIEQLNTNLANLYVASYRLHGTLDRQEVLDTIQEIIVNLVGSEEIGIFELDPEQSMISLVRCMGIDEERYKSVPLGRGVIGRVVQTGQALFADGDALESDADGEGPVTACIPLKVDGRIMGAIAVFKLLPQKVGLEALDHEMFELLATHAATAMYATGLHAKVGSGVPS